MADWAVSPVIVSIWEVDVCFSGMLLIVCVEFLLRMKLSMSAFVATFAGLFSGVWCFLIIECWSWWMTFLGML